MANEFFQNYGTTVYNKANLTDVGQYKNSAEYFKRVYRHCLPTDRNAAILDIGCGAGHFLWFLEESGYRNCRGIDISPEQVEASRGRVKCPVDVADAMHFLDDKQGTYDLIAAHDVLEHVPKDKVLALVKKILAALNNDGVLVARVPNMSNPLAVHARYIDFTHELGFTERSLEQLLMVAGFAQVDVVGGLIFVRSGVRSSARKIFLKAYYAWIRFLYYVQDFAVPRILDHNMIAICRKRKTA